MNYENMSDFEINKAVAELQPYTMVIGEGKYPSISEDAVYVEKKAFKYDNVTELGADYCNNPADAWPIIVENKIDIRYEGAFRHDWEVMHCKHLDEYDVDIVGPVNHKNPLRAAMIVYLMMQEDKK